MKIYLGGGLVTEKDIEHYMQVKKILKSAGHKVKYPLPYYSTKNKEETFDFDKVIKYSQNSIEWADVIYIDFNVYERIAAGSISEIALASYLKKFIIVSINSKNPNYNVFIKNISDLIFKNHNDAISYLCNIKG